MTAAASDNGKVPPGKAPPTNTAPPTITGFPVASQTLASSDGSWTGPGLNFSYQWLRCDSLGLACSVVSGANQNTYPLASADVGSAIRVTVTASNRYGSASASSAPTSAVATAPAPASTAPPANSSLPGVSGTPTVGQALSATTGSWSGSPTSYAYAWKRCDSAGANCNAISGATSASYTLASADTGFTLRVMVTATNSGGSASATSAQSGLVRASAPPANTALPVISGTATVGQVLSATTGSWSGSPSSYAYAWKRCDSAGANCNAISGATSAAYTLATADAGFTARVAVTATNSGGSASATSVQSAVIQAEAPAPAASSSRFGIAAGWRLPWLSATDRTRYLDLAKTMGTKIVRFDIDWPSIQAGGPTSYNWAAQDAVVQGLNARGITVLGDIAYTPAWARPSGTTDKYPPTNVSDYGNFCGAAARHYSPMGVHNWEVWNEPNIVPFFQPAPDIAKYTAMLKACYTQIKAADPGATVVTGGMSPAGSYNAPCGGASCANINPINFLQGIYANGGKGYFDALGHHPYSFPSRPSTIATWSAWYQMFGTSPSLRSVMSANGDDAKKVWATEWGAPTNGPLGSGAVSEAEQAYQVTEAFKLFGSYSWAGPLFVYNFRDDGTSTATRENFFGLIRYDFSLKPAYSTYQAAAAAG